MEFTRDQAKILIETSATVEMADKFIDENYKFETVGEKVAFLKGMFDVRIIGHEDKEPDEMDYFAMLAAIIRT